MNKIKNYCKGLKLNQKFSIVIAVLVFLPMIIFSCLLFGNMRDRIISQAQSEADYYVSENIIAAQKVVEMCNMSTQTFLNNQELQQFLTRLMEGEEISTREYMDFSENNISMLERLVNSNPYLYYICVYAENNDFPEMVPILYHGERAERADWYHTYQTGEWQYDYPDRLHSYSRMNESGHLMALVSDLTNSDGEKVGIVEVAVAMDEVFEKLYDETEGVWACLEAGDGTVYGGADEKWTGKQSELLKEADQMQSGSSRHLKMDGEDIILTVQKIDGLGASYLQVNSLKEPLGKINLQRNLLLALLAGSFLGMVLIIKRLVKVLLAGFYRILQGVRQVQNGRLDTRIHEETRDEVGELGCQIDQMLDRIQKLMTENINREVLVKNTEIKALQNQINAHFIYNVLESVKMMAEISEEYDISDAVTALGELLRYGMKWVSGTVEISQELEYIKNYVQLMNLRYDFIIRLSISLPDFVYGQQIPKMSLQPIIENAICHGIEDMDQDAVIYIKGEDLGADYRIEITDSGIGMSPDKKEILEKKLRGELEVSGGSGNGIGLKNVQDRIRLEFGPGYGLSFYSKEGCYTKVSILLPKTNVQGNGEKNENIIDCGR
ncbi:MAG: histidine kinase [Lachnospiraceae bacterium]|nr:histidine kinase [Lachnospiraceae bacterium]